MMKTKLTALVLALLLCAAATGCSSGGSGEESAGESNEDNTISNVSVSNVSEEDTEGDWDNSSAVRITLKGDSIEVAGTGAAASGSTLTITAAGTYVLSGTLDDGQIVVAADKTDTVRLVLNGADLSCSTSAPIYSQKAEKTILTLADGTQNSVSDGAEYVYPDASTDEPDAAIFVKDDLTINGNGALTVTGNYNNGIGAKDDLVITGGTITVSAVNHGIRGRDSITILDGIFDITAGNDGIQSNNDTGDDKGWILLEGGTYRINAAHDGVQAETSLTVSGGTYDIVTGGGHDGVVSDATGSYKGLKTGTNLVVSGGEFTIDSADDTLHANGDVTISNGSLLLASGDDGVHADETLSIHGGTIDITTSYEGLEGSVIIITDGVIRLVASDDGINVAGGNDSSGGGGRFGQDRFGEVSGDLYLDISGGWISVTASGDGLDSNGNINVSGGTILVNGPTNNGDAPLDYDGQFAISGGVLVAAGSSGMAQAPGSTSEQATLMVYYSSTQAAGTPVHLAKEDGTPILTYTPTKDYQSVVISTPELEQGAVYQLYSGGSDAGDAVDGLVLESSYTGGTLLTTVTLSEITTRVSDSGEAVSGGFGGFGGFGGGGMQPPDGGNRPEGPGDMPPGEGGPDGKRGTPPGGEQ